MSMFEKASRLQLRFQSKGQLSVEDLWSIPLTELDAIAKTLNKAIRGADEEQSFIPGAKSTKATLEAEKTALSFEIVKHIITVRVQERDERAAAADRAARKHQLRELLAKKEDQALEGKTAEEIQAMIDAL